MKKRRIEAKMRLEGLSEMEENRIRVKSSTYDADNVMRNPYNSKTSPTSSPQEERGSSRPLTTYKPIPFCGDEVGEVLEL